MLDDAPGWDSPAGKRLRAVMACLTLPAAWRSPDFENALTLPLGDGPELVEQDLSARSPDQPDLTPPFAITGCIEKIGEEDRFGFSATKDERLLLEIQSASLGFPLDAWLAIQDATGKELVMICGDFGSRNFATWYVVVPASMMMV